MSVQRSEVKRWLRELVDVDAYVVDYTFDSGFDREDERDIKDDIDLVADMDADSCVVDDSTVVIDAMFGGGGHLYRSSAPTDDGFEYEYEAEMTGTINLDGERSVDYDDPGEVRVVVDVFGVGKP